MLFNSVEFAIFLPLVLLLFRMCPRRGRQLLLVTASYVFYGFWDWRFLSLLLLSTVVDYFCARSIAGTEDQALRKRLLYVSLAVNLGVLGFFKYFGFFVESFRTAFGLGGGLGLEIILPVGISFYTFQTLGYTIDVYRGHTRPAQSFITFALYVSFFPQLVAGPIERSTSLLPQLEVLARPAPRALFSGLELILLGLFKKVFIADGIAPLVDQAFAAPQEQSSLALLLATWLFAIQIWGDFSGYTDIARGVARLFGVEIRINFSQPYLSANITEFWRRWHISLSTWLRDYLYIPLGGNRRGPIATYRNLMLTMLLGGLWHGAAWTFVIWGALHGLWLAIHRALGRRDRIVAQPRSVKAFFVHAVRVCLTFQGVCLAWIFFRAESLSQAITYLSRLFSAGGTELQEGILPVGIFYLATAFAIEILHRRSERGRASPAEWPAWLRGVGYALMILLISFVGTPNVRPFIYFQF